MKTIAKIAVMALCLTPTVASAEKLSLQQLSAYLNQLNSAKGTFTQVNPNNSRSKGDFMIKRPGKMRFEYDAPNPALVVASSGQIAIFDKKSSAGPQGFPIGRTPLGLILKKNVNLGTSGMVISHVEDGPTTKVVVQHPARPNHGNIQLVFTSQPIALREWVVTDQSGKKTKVILGRLTNGVSLSNNLFNIEKIAADMKQVFDR